MSITNTEINPDSQEHFDKSKLTERQLHALEVDRMTRESLDIAPNSNGFEGESFLHRAAELANMGFGGQSASRLTDGFKHGHRQKELKAYLQDDRTPRAIDHDENVPDDAIAWGALSDRQKADYSYEGDLGDDVHLSQAHVFKRNFGKKPE